MADSAGPRRHVRLEKPLQLTQLSGLLHGAEAPIFPDYGQASGIVPAIFEAPQALK
jgi:hypothetical protein